MLLLHANEPVARERLIDELWGGAAPRTVNAVLNVYLSKLRRLLADGAGEQPLLTQAAGYVLSVPPEGLDARRFESLLERGRQQLVSGHPEHASTTLRDALALWRGPPLADLALESFAQTEITRLEELRLTALEARIDADLALGRQDSLVAELETLVATHPYREGLRAQLMLALYRNGRQAEALETYRRARRTFTEELGIEPGPRLQELEGAILRHDSSIDGPRGDRPPQEEERIRTTPRTSRISRHRTLALAAALTLSIVAALAAAARHSSGSPEPVVLAGDSLAVIDPGTDTIVGEIPVGNPGGPAVGEGSVWVGNRDDNTLLRIDPSSLEVVRTISVGVAPYDVEVGAGGVWVLGGRRFLLRVDPAINDVVARVALPRRRGQPWTHMEVGANAVYVCSCAPLPLPGNFVRVDSVTTDITHFRIGPVGQIAYGEGGLWALTGYEADRIDRIDPETNAVVGTIPLGRIGEVHGHRQTMAVGDGAIWVGSQESLWRIDPMTDRIQGSVPLGIDDQGNLGTGHSVVAGDGAVWVASFDNVVLRVDPESQTVAKTIPLGALIYPWGGSDAVAVGEGAVWVAVNSFAS